MFVEGMILRNGYHDLNTLTVKFPAEITVYLHGPDDPQQELGRASIERRTDGCLYAGFYISEFDVGALEENPFFAVALAKDDEGNVQVVHLGLTDRNQDPEIPPVEAY